MAKGAVRFVRSVEQNPGEWAELTKVKQDTTGDSHADGLASLDLTGLDGKKNKMSARYVLLGVDDDDEEGLGEIL